MIKEYQYTNIDCPSCKAMMEWASTTDAPHIVDYHCDKCDWKGDFNHLSGTYDEYTAEDYGY